MKRYHTTMGTGDGIETGVMREIPANIDSGFWVYYDEAQVEIENALNRGFERGFEEGLTQGKAAPVKSVESAKYSQPKLKPGHDSDRKRLLNELYHDRARLERVVRDAAHLMGKVVAYAESYHWVDEDGESVVNDYPLLGSLEQFVDTHKE